MDDIEKSPLGIAPAIHDFLPQQRSSSQASEANGESGNPTTPEIQQDSIEDLANQGLHRDSPVGIQDMQLDEQVENHTSDPAPNSHDGASQGDKIAGLNGVGVTTTFNALGGRTTVYCGASSLLKFEEPDDSDISVSGMQNILQDRGAEVLTTESHLVESLTQVNSSLQTAGLAYGVSRGAERVGNDLQLLQIPDNPAIPEANIEAACIEATGVETGLRVSSAGSVPDNSSPTNPSKSRSVSKKQRRKPARTAAEAHIRRHQDIAGKKRKTDHGNHGWMENIINSQPLSKARKTARASQKKPNLFTTLTHNDVFSAHEAGTDHGEASDIPARTKKAQIDQILSTSSAYDMHKCITSPSELLKVSQRFGLNKVKPANGFWKLIGILFPLYAHQLIGVDWMLQREFSLPGEGPFGGICADVMGLGKTVEILSVAVHNPGGPTLIVMPAGILDQWEAEIARILEGDFGQRVMRYKRSHHVSKVIYETCDFVLTSYNELRMSCVPIDGPTKKQLDKLLRSNPTAYEDWIEENIELCGNLHQISWHRVVLDEGHIIKNHKSITSLAATALKGKYRWILSGTPIMNRLGEFYAHLRFLKVPGLPHRQKFLNIFCVEDDTQCQLNMGLLLAKVMIRRTHDDRIFGKPLVTLPKPRKSRKLVNLLPEEMILYRHVETLFRQILNKKFAKGDKIKNLSYLIVQLTRLRQLTAHPLLVEREIMIMFTKQQLLTIRNKVRLVGDLLHKRIDIWIKEKDDAETLESLDRQAAEGTVICKICGDIAEEPHRLSTAKCQDTFCKRCIQESAQIQVAEGSEEPKCPICNATFDAEQLKPLRNNNVNSPRMVNSPLTSKNKKGKDNIGNSPTVHPSEWLRAWDDEEVLMLQSAKVEGVLTQLMEWLQEEPEDKVIIFTQWRALAGILGRRLEKLNIGFVYYAGDMSLEKRAISTQEFERQPEIKVLVSGLKCGSLGLNWTFACKVINVDLWWNTCVEDQGFGRVYRIGQKKESYLSRVVTANTVDHRILKLQKKKNMMFEGAMKDQVTQEELVGLFGRVTTDSNGRTFIEADYDDDPDWDDADLDLVDENAQDTEMEWQNREF